MHVLPPCVLSPKHTLLIKSQVGLVETLQWEWWSLSLAPRLIFICHPELILRCENSDYRIILKPIQFHNHSILIVSRSQTHPVTSHLAEKTIVITILLVRESLGLGLK